MDVNLRETFVDLFELPREVLLKHPLFLMLGNGNIYLENHRGIGYYGPNKVIILVEPGEVVVEGEGLRIQEIYPHTIRIRGRVHNLAFIFPGGDQKSE